MSPRDCHSEEPPDLSAGLIAACEAHASALLVSLVQGATASVQMSAEDEHAVNLAPSAVVEPEAFLVGSSCLVAFQHDKSTHAFLSHVRSRVIGDGGCVLAVLVDLPEKVLRMESRSSFRVPALEGHGLSACIELGSGESIEGKPVDISLGGILLDFGEEAEPLRPGTQVTIGLSREGRVVKRPATVRHCRDGRVGFCIDPDGPDGEVCAPFRLLVKEMERHWLRNRSC